MPRLYFFSYAHTRGFGNFQVALDGFIGNLTDVRGVQALIAEQIKQPADSVVILHWRHFESAAAE